MNCSRVKIRSQKPDVRGQKSDVRCQKSEVRLSILCTLSSVLCLLFSVFCLLLMTVSSVTLGAMGEPKSRSPVTFRAGAAASNITPPLDKPVVGGWASPPGKHVHDELYAKCLVLDDGTIRITRNRWYL